jgi:Tol biopolymer transport system component
VADGSIRVLKSLEHNRHPRSISPDGRYVTYDSWDSSEGNIFLLATDGSHETVLAEHPAYDFAPLWTPDGNQIVFASDRSGTRGVWTLEVVNGNPKGSPQLISDNLNGMTPLGLTQNGSYYYALPGRDNDVYFADLDPETGEVLMSPMKAVQVFEGLNSQPTFSPDGKRLAYVSMRRPGGLYSRSLVVRSLETGEEQEIQPDIPLTYQGWFVPRWSPDGSSILVVARFTDSAKKKRMGIHRIDVETGAVTPLVWQDEQGNIAKPPPVWSPDGNKMFFRRHVGGIRTYDLETRQERELDFRSKHGMDYKIHALALSPDGQQLAFVGCLKGGHSFQIAPSAGGETREVLAKSAFLETAGLVWTPDGRYLLFAKWNKEDKMVELRRTSVEGGEPQSLGLTMKKIEHLSIHPDGRRITFTGPGLKRGPEVWIMENILPTSTASR